MIEITETTAGRETLAAIAEELRTEARPRQDTLPYGDRVSNAPGAITPARESQASAPELTVGQAPIGRETLNAIAEELVSRPAPFEPPAPDAPLDPATPPPIVAIPIDPSRARVPVPLEIFELSTFIVRGSDVPDLTTEPLRRRFVTEHLLHRIPGGTLDAVERIEVTPWTAHGTLVVRVWHRLPPAAGSS